MNISLLLRMAADAEPDRVGLTCEGRHWTYSELWSAATGAAMEIERSGASHIALLDTSSEAALIALMGAAMAGIPYCPLNYRLADPDLAALIERIEPVIVIGDTERLAKLRPSTKLSALSREEFLKAATHTVGPEREASEREGIAVQIFTSGTTATPKAAVLRHSNLLSYILGTVEFGVAEKSEGALLSVPPYHIAGIAALLSSIYAMRRIILLPAFEPNAWIELVANERPTNAFVVPTMLSRIIEVLDSKAPAQLDSLRAIAYGGGRMPFELITRALDLLPGTDFTNAYGLTETSSTITLLSPDEHRIARSSNDPKIKARLGSVGRPLPTIELEIRGEDGRKLPAGSAGEIYVRGEQVSGEYRERSTLDTEGWFPTRDTGYLDEEGYLFLSGRADDVIVRGGENISPGEIEEVLLAHPSVADAAAVGVPSAEWGEAIVVAIALKGPEPAHDDLKSLIRTHLRSSRVPEKILVVDALPYNEMGKLLRRNIRNFFE